MTALTKQAKDRQIQEHKKIMEAHQRAMEAACNKPLSPPEISQWVRVHTNLGALDGVCISADKETRTWEVYFPAMEGSQIIDPEAILALGPVLEAPKF